jgi:metal-responsive CopG/Arc/MetJ family transcriptional regulator
MKTAISIPDTLFREAEQLSKRLRIPRSQLYARALETYVRDQRSRGITEALNAIYDTESSGLDSLISGLQTEALDPEGW